MSKMNSQQEKQPMTKVLVLVEHYLDGNYHAMSFVHSRLLKYPVSKFDITVLSFKNSHAHVIDGIKVISEQDATHQLIEDTDIILSHAPNLRNHFRFLFKNWKFWNTSVFFFHGHEVLIGSKYYPPAYPFFKKNSLKELLRTGYDFIKVKTLRFIFQVLFKSKNIYYVFVSQWMLDAFIDCIGFEPNKNEKAIIYNPSHPIFESQNYDYSSKKIADFVTLRPLDSSKYAVDLILELAQKNPDLTFHIYGQGSLFNYLPRPANVEHFNVQMKQEDIPNILNRYSCALMPTRIDAQGVMMCEMATFGIPVITSNLEICREVLKDFSNVVFAPNEDFGSLDLKRILGEIKESSIKNERFFSKNTTNVEIEFIETIANSRSAT